MENNKRTLKAATMDLFEDQINFLEAEANRTGSKKAQLIRQAIDEKYGLPLEKQDLNYQHDGKQD